MAGPIWDRYDDPATLEMDVEDKISALVEEGGLTRKRAIAFLVDMGDVSESEAETLLSS